MASSSQVLNYVTANRFYVEIESSVSASFTECQGLGVTIKADKFSEGGVNNQQRVLLSPAEFSDVTLKRGITDDLTFWNWINSVLGGKVERRNVNILVFNQAGETMQCWTLIGAVPTSWKAPGLSADSTAVAIEELTLTYEGLKVAKSGSGGASLLPGRDGSGYFASN
jgi:phage tail-like protein